MDSNWPIGHLDDGDLATMPRLLGRTGIYGGNQYLPISSNCVLYIAFWDGTAKDHSSYLNHGTVNGGASFVTNGLTFNGSNAWVSIPSPHDELYFYHNKPHSIEAFIKPTNFAAYRGIVSKRQTPSTPDYSFFTAITTGKQGSYDALNERDSNTPLTAGQWTAVAYSFDGTTLTFFKNGAADGGGTQNFLNSYGFPDAPVAIGAAQATPADMFLGTIGEVRIWKVALTPTEILSNYNLTKARYSL